MSSRAFGDDESSDDEPAKPVLSSWKAAAANSTKRQNPYAMKMKTPATTPPVDQSIYAYDEVYDEVSHTKKLEATRKNTASMGPQYINRLLEAKNKRQEDKSRVMDLKVARERESEGNEYKDKEVFVTTLYKEHREKVAEKEQREERDDAKVDMSKFHKAMLDQEESGEPGPLKISADDRERAYGTQEELKSGLNVSSRPVVSSSWQPHKKQKVSRQSESESVLKQIEELQAKREAKKEQSFKSSRLLPKLSDKEIEQYRRRYLERKAKVPI